MPDAQLDCSYWDEAKVHILNFKTTWLEFQMPSETAAEQDKAKL